MRARLPLIATLGFGLTASIPVLAAERVSSYGRWVSPAEAASAPAGQPPRRSVAKTYGTATQILYSAGPCDGHPREVARPYEATNCEIVTPLLDGTEQASIAFPFHLPDGALIEEISFSYFDSHSGEEPSVGVFKYTGPSTFETVLDPVFPVFDSGANNVSFAVDPPHVVDNQGRYVVLVILFIEDSTHYVGLYGVTVGYRLQVSPAPSTATFGDVPTDHPFYQFIEALAASGITGGCGGGNYCPNNAVTRGQMAVFMSKALGLHFPN